VRGFGEGDATVLSGPAALRVRKCQANLYSWLALKEMKASGTVIKVELNYSSSRNLLCLPKLLIKVFFCFIIVTADRFLSQKNCGESAK
jgi:hypothetical protein